MVSASVPDLLQSQFANDDSDDEEEDAEGQQAGAEAFLPHAGCGHGGVGCRS